MDEPAPKRTRNRIRFYPHDDTERKFNEIQRRLGTKEPTETFEALCDQFLRLTDPSFIEDVADRLARRFLEEEEAEKGG